MTSTRAVIFDVDGTLYAQPPVRRSMALRLMRAHALHPRTGRRVARVLREFRHVQEELRADAVSGSAQQQAAITAARVGLPVEQVEHIVVRWIQQEPLKILARHKRADLEQTLDALRAAGVRLGVVSDYPAHDKLVALGVRDAFDVVVCAQDPDVGTFKPHPRGLRVCLARLGIEPDHALYVGDRPDTDAAAARASAVRCVIIGSRSASAADHGSISSLSQLRTLREKP